MDIAEFLANFLRRIVKKTGQKLILGFNFINKNSEDFYVLQLCFFGIFGFDSKRMSKIAKNLHFGGFSHFLAIFE